MHVVQERGFLSRTNIAQFVEKYIDEAFDRLCYKLEPSLMDTEGRDVDIANKITLAELGALRVCFNSRDRCEDLLLTLFFPPENASRHTTFGLPAFDYQEEVAIDE